MNLSQLGKWTPYAVIIVLSTASLLAVILWYSFHYMQPPDWIFTALGVLGGGSLVGMGHSQGVATANGVAKDAVNNLMNAAKDNSSGTSHTP